MSKDPQGCQECCFSRSSYTINQATQRVAMKEGSPGDKNIRDPDIPRGGNLEDCDWNTCSTGQRQFILRMDCHDRATLRREPYQIEDVEDRRPRVYEPILSGDQQPRRHTNPDTL